MNSSVHDIFLFLEGDKGHRSPLAHDGAGCCSDSSQQLGALEVSMDTVGHPLGQLI
jgi:hypothetical protein